MKLLMDIDDVWYPWYQTAHELCCEAGIVPKLDNGEFLTPQTWAAHEEYGVDKEVWVKVLEEAGRDLYFADPEPIFLPFVAWAAMWEHEIWFVTARGSFGPPPMQKNIRLWTREYLEHLGLGWRLRDRLIFSKDKTVLRVDAAIDDNLGNVTALAATGAKTFMMTQPWNVRSRPPAGVTRVYSLATFKTRITELEESTL